MEIHERFLVSLGGGGGPMTRLPFGTGFPGVDDAFGGICPGEVTVFAGAPGSGKTAALVHVAAHINVPVMLFAQPGAAARFRDGEWNAVVKIEDSGLGSLKAIERLALEARNVHGIGAVFIDDFHLLEGVRPSWSFSQRRGMNRFRRFVRKSGLAVLVSWGVEARPGLGANWADLRGTIVEEPDLLMLAQETNAAPRASRIATFHPMPRDHRDTFVYDRLSFVA